MTRVYQLVLRMWIPVCALVVVSCDKSGGHSRKDPESIRLEGRRVELEHKVAVAQLKADRVARKVTQDMTPMADLKDRTVRLRELASLKSALESDIRSLEEGLLQARAGQLQKARSQMLGKELADLQSRTGRVYEQVKVVSIDDSGVQIRHASGSARLGCSELTEAQCEQFGLDEGLARTARLEEDRQRLVYEQGVERELAANRKLEALEAPAALPAPMAPSVSRPSVSPFDRRVSLGSSETVSDRVVARYRTQRRTTVYYYPYVQPTPSCYSPVPTYRNTVGWSSGLPSVPQTTPRSTTNP